jgi:organic hydroperoxide reductase OsmC/OhrA
MMKLPIRNVRVKVSARYHRAGSILAGTATAGCDSIRTDVQLESDEPEERIAELIRVAENSCYTIGALRNPVPTELTVELNGRQLRVG